MAELLRAGLPDGLPSDWPCWTGAAVLVEVPARVRMGVMTEAAMAAMRANLGWLVFIFLKSLLIKFVG